MSADEHKDNPNTRLVDAVRQVKIAAAERNDVVVDMKEADRARLEILAQELKPVFDDVPADDERFDFAISSGLQPRLWIDATAHVMMGRDRRTYRFVRDTRLGRTILAEATAVDPVMSAVTTYIAERLHEREMAFAADEMVTYRAGVSQRGPAPVEDAAETASGPGEAERAGDDASVAEAAPLSRRERTSVTRMSRVGWLLIGGFIALAAAALYFQDLLVP
ncbi:MAG: hypothetical protein JJ926_08265 [Roseitalea sp.]|jgi:hypothetical protein|uniref:hypothetical protein n=1 Tax=Oceaniradius stylonematis TaxID=2184161 RepID=UPI0018C8BDE9|nr:hypothetical protein [Oceaniradius stylonematis]MBO6551759.1 hypothetical protein [Roseitalea sp.]MBO6951861.1 hypothetical protein [Rhizobiaceae bacterium]MBO6592293.1 hypothetical protein [Roseitalea sp.]MBO6598548.1 hypothetical protein [Roseitalea sp.]MBO6610994.1 hypothetical protein [Roseitalea sp.]